MWSSWWMATRCSTAVPNEDAVVSPLHPCRASPSSYLTWGLSLKKTGNTTISYRLSLQSPGCLLPSPIGPLAIWQVQYLKSLPLKWISKEMKNLLFLRLLCNAYFRKQNLIGLLAEIDNWTVSKIWPLSLHYITSLCCVSYIIFKWHLTRSMF